MMEGHKGREKKSYRKNTEKMRERDRSKEKNSMNQFLQLRLNIIQNYLKSISQNIL